MKRDLQLMGTDPKTPFNVTGMEILDAPEGLFKLSQRTVQAGQRYVISIEVTEPRQERSIRGQLKIKTDHPGMPEVAARIYAQFGTAAPAPLPSPRKPVTPRPARTESPIKGTSSASPARSTRCPWRSRCPPLRRRFPSRDASKRCSDG